MKNNRRVSAFSLIELSIAILIIGILVAGVTQASRLLAQAKLSSARMLTQSSPISSIRNLSLWIDSTSDSSFQSADLDDGTTITAWKDLNPQAATKADFTVTGTPTYKTGIINGLPAVCFNNTTNCGSSSGTTNYFSSANFSNISTASTIFAVIKLPNPLPSTGIASASQAILSKRDNTQTYNVASTSNLQLSTVSTSVGWGYCDGTTQSTSSAATCNFVASGASPIAGKNYVISIVYTHGAAATANSTATGLNFFQNGSALSQVDTDTGTAPFTSTNITNSPLLIGKPSVSTVTANDYFKGYIGEVIVFDRALRKEERQSIEAYLGKKWGITMTVATY